MRAQWRPLIVFVAAGSLLAGCACQADTARPAPSTPAGSRTRATLAASAEASSPSGTPGASAGTADARGVEISTVPDWITDADQQVAARFVILANTPDGQVDESAAAAWRRAAGLATPELAADMRSGRVPMGGAFAQVKAKRGWMSVSIENVLGGAQAPGASAGPGPIPILFTQSVHVGDKVTRDQTVQEWDVTVTGGKVSNFDAKES